MTAADPLARLLDLVRPAWHARAACRGAPLGVFFPPDMTRGQSYVDVGWSADAALSVCAGCPVADDCFAAAVGRGERWGIWGGEDFAASRRRARRQEGAA